MTITLPLPAALDRTLQPSRARLHLAIDAFVIAYNGKKEQNAPRFLEDLQFRRVPDIKSTFSPILCIHV
jgi:hypothetical protein